MDFDPEAKIGYGYILNRQDTYFMDPRDIALRRQCTARLARQIRIMGEYRYRLQSKVTALRHQSKRIEMVNN